MRTIFLQGAAFVLAAASSVNAAEAPQIERELITVSGWTVHVNKRLRVENPKQLETAISLLQAQLDEIVRVVPEPALGHLRGVPLYFSPRYQGQQPRAEYHPGEGWLKAHGRDPVMAKAVEFTCIDNFEAETRRMPNFAMHELAHSYHDLVLAAGFANAEVKHAYEKAKASGTYDRVKRWTGSGFAQNLEKAYAMTNPMEYFAENTEAYFSRNDFFPFNREELFACDPEMHELLGRLWGSKK